MTRSPKDLDKLGVKTTGVYYRPCERCKPDRASANERDTRKIAAACRLIERSEHTPPLAELAEHVDVSAYHFHRLFKAATGLTPIEYAAAHRSRRLRSSLGKSNTVTRAIYDAGFNSSSRCYENTNGVLGMTPSQFRAGGANTEIHFAIAKSSLGPILVAKSEKGVCSILIGDDPSKLVSDLRNQFPNANLIGNEPAFEDVVARVVSLIEEPNIGTDLPLDIRGTTFQQRVWKALQQIPPGSTASYSDIAKEIGQPKAVRAVAQACASNVLAVAIPCHRVVRSDGSLSGYRWGLERKRALLEREVRT